MNKQELSRFKRIQEEQKKLKTYRNINRGTNNNVKQSMAKTKGKQQVEGKTVQAASDSNSNKATKKNKVLERQSIHGHKKQGQILKRTKGDEDT